MYIHVDVQIGMRVLKHCFNIVHVNSTGLLVSTEEAQSVARSISQRAGLANRVVKVLHYQNCCYLAIIWNGRLSQGNTKGKK